MKNSHINLTKSTAYHDNANTIDHRVRHEKSRNRLSSTKRFSSSFFSRFVVESTAFRTPEFYMDPFGSDTVLILAIGVAKVWRD